MTPTPENPTSSLPATSENPPETVSPAKRKRAAAPPEFPIEIKKGSATVKIYRGDNRGREMFTVSHVGVEGRKRENFFDLSVAIETAKSHAEKLAAGDLEALRLTGHDRLMFVAACSAIQPTGLTLDIAARDFATAFSVLGGNIVIEAARYYARHVLNGLPEMTVEKAVDAFVLAKDNQGQSKLYKKDLRLILKRFKEAFVCQLREVTSTQIEEYLVKLNVGPVTRNNHLRLIRGLFSHAKAYGWLDRNETTAADAIGTAKARRGVVEIYTPQEMSDLLTAADDMFRAWLVLVGFCGVRREEVSRLTWDAVDFAKGVVIVPADVAKTGVRRKIVLRPNAAAWLADYRNEKGTIFAIDPQKRMMRTIANANAARAKRGAAPLEWKTNALRHSFCSYRLEQTQNAGAVALEAGNSAGIVMKHYHEVVSAEDAAAWWNILPATKAANVTPFKAAAA